MRGLAAAARFQRIVCRFQHILRRGAAHDQKPRRIDAEGMEPRRIKPAIFACSLFLLDPDDGAPILCGALCRAGGKGERKAGRRHMRARIFGKDLVQRIARQTMRKGGIGPGKAKRETAGARKTAPVLASCPAGKTALRIIACNGRNHAPQRRDVDAAHVRFLSNCSLFVLVLNRARQESSGIRRRDQSAACVDKKNPSLERPAFIGTHKGRSQREAFIVMGDQLGATVANSSGRGERVIFEYRI